MQAASSSSVAPMAASLMPRNSFGGSPQLCVRVLVDLHQIACLVKLQQVAYPRKDGDVGNGEAVAHSRDGLTRTAGLLQRPKKYLFCSFECPAFVQPAKVNRAVARLYGVGRQFVKPIGLRRL